MDDVPPSRKWLLSARLFLRLGIPLTSSSSRGSGSAPKIVVKKEPPSSPSLPNNSRHRPRKLDLSTNIAAAPAGLSSRPSATPLTAREGIALQEAGMAVLSPGFQTQDPTMREHIHRSLSVREQQRSIIESRLLKTAKGDGPEGQKPSEMSNPFGKPTGSMSKKRPPPGLSIVPPSAEQFANERVIQSAPLGQTFTGRHQPHPMSRQVANQSSNLAQTSHIHHVPAVQTNNRLPPISDVFGAETLGPNSRPGFYHSNSASDTQSNRPFPSPGFAPHTVHPTQQQAQQPPPLERPREFRSAEEAVHELTGGREDLLPRIVHYGGAQPPTPPSPQTGSGSRLTPRKYTPNHTTQHSGNGQEQRPSGWTSKRRSRNEYEADSSPPLGTGRERENMRYGGGPFGEGRDSPETQRRKKEEFLGLCSRAWDLFHS
jgi:hypothetical protein